MYVVATIIVVSSLLLCIYTNTYSMYKYSVIHVLHRRKTISYCANAQVMNVSMIRREYPCWSLSYPFYISIILEYIRQIID